MARAAGTRILTFAAAGFLAFDGAALAGIGFWLGKLALGVIGVGLFLSSGLVLLAWRKHCRQLEEIAAARRALGEEARALAALVRKEGQ